eukprot:scaffold10376_cov66-Phaeocystis_antarctica.AAC.5
MRIGIGARARARPAFGSSLASGSAPAHHRGGGGACGGSDGGCSGGGAGGADGGIDGGANGAGDGGGGEGL